VIARQAPPVASTGGIRPFPAVHSDVLGNEMKLDVIERRSMPIVHVSLLVASGHAKDGNRPGAARVLAQLLESGGAGPWSSARLREIVDGLGSSLEIVTTRDSMRWSLAVTSDKLPIALDILAALAQKPHFDRAEFKKLKDRELERVRSLARTSGSWLAQYWLHRELYQQAIGIHPYASVDVLPSELERLTLEDCRSFFRSELVPSNARLLVVGDVGPDMLRRESERTFGKWTGKPPGELSLTEPHQPERMKVFVLDRPGSAQSDVQVGLFGPARSSADFPAVLTLQQIVGGGVAGRLFLDVREKRSLAYSTYSGIQEVKQGPSVLTLSAGTQTAKTSETVAALLEHLDGLRGNPGSLGELEMAQSYVVRGMPARWETVESLSSQVVMLRNLGLGEHYFDELREEVSALSTPLLKEPASRYYVRSHAVVVVAGDATRIAEGMTRFGAVDVLDPEKEFSIKRSLPAQ
jgi:predicted Zn-dependent peptidase